MTTLTKMALAAFAGLLLGGGALALGQDSADDGLTTTETETQTTVEPSPEAPGMTKEETERALRRGPARQRPALHGRGRRTSRQLGARIGQLGAPPR